jgi:hypothetical protein
MWWRNENTPVAVTVVVAAAIQKILEVSNKTLSTEGNT